MNKTYNPSIRNGKPVLVSKTEKIDKSRIMDEAYFEERLSELKGYQIVEVSKELLDAFPECWYQEWGFYDRKPIEVFYPEGHTGKWPLEEGVDFNITRPFHLEGTQRVERLVAIPLLTVTEAITITGTIPEEEHVRQIEQVFAKAGHDITILGRIEDYKKPVKEAAPVEDNVWKEVYKIFTHGDLDKTWDDLYKILNSKYIISRKTN